MELAKVPLRYIITIFLVVAIIISCTFNNIDNLQGRLSNISGGVLDNDSQINNKTYVVPKYRFPTIDERFEYYMGDWYNKTDWEVTNCTEYVKLDDNTTRNNFFGAFHDMIFSLETLRACRDITSYCNDAYNTLKQAKSDDQNLLAMFKFGDTYTSLVSHPVISKARPVLGNKNSHAPIIWPLETRRHYRPVEQLYKIKKSNQEIDWDGKESKVFWRGTTTGRRVELLNQWIHYDTNVIDIAFNNVVQKRFNKGFRHNYLEMQNTRQKADITEMLKYKYLLSIEGNDVATGLKWMLYSNSVVLLSPPTVSTWAMEDLLLPFVHYIPLSSDYSNLLEMMKWAEEHQDACQVISKRATDFIKHMIVSKQAQIDTDILRERLATAYKSQFQTQLATCGETKAPNGFTWLSNNHIDDEQGSSLSASHSHN